MNLRRAKTVYKKELVDILRDRRTLIAMIVVPIVLYPMLMLGSIQAVTVQTGDAENEQIIIGLNSEREWRIVKPLFEEELDIVNRLRAAAVARGASDEELAALPVAIGEFIDANAISQPLEDAVLQREIQCGIIVEDAGDDSDEWTHQIALRIVYQPEEFRSELAYQRIVEAFERVASWRKDRRLARLNIDSRTVQPIILVESRVSSSGSVLGLILPLVLVLMTITGAIYPAIDLTAGERERGTLETLMVCPVPVIDLIVGKFLVVTTIAIIGAALNLASVTATIYLGGFEQVLGVDGGGQSRGFPFAALPVILLCLVPFAVLASAIMIAVCSLARSFKEAQNYITPVILAVLVPGGIAALPGTRLTGVMLVTPVANMVLLTRELLSGASIPGATFVWVLMSTCLYAAAAVAVAAHVFGRESVVFADTISFKTLFTRRLIQPRPHPSLTGAAVCTALLFPFWFYVQGWLQMASDADVASVLRGTAMLMPVFFVLLPLSILAYWKIDVVATFRLKTPEVRYLLAAILIGITAWVPAHELFIFQDRYIGSPPALAEMDKALHAALSIMPVALVFLVLAFVPAVCEELYFRGFLLSGLATELNRWTAIVAAGCVFAAFHFFIFKFAMTAMLGVGLGWLCWSSRSIWPGMLAHALHNGCMVLAVIWPAWPESFGISSDDPMAHVPLKIAVPACLIFCAALVLIGWTRATLPESSRRATEVAGS